MSVGRIQNTRQTPWSEKLSACFLLAALKSENSEEVNAEVYWCLLQTGMPETCR